MKDDLHNKVLRKLLSDLDQHISNAEVGHTLHKLGKTPAHKPAAHAHPAQPHESKHTEEKPVAVKGAPAPEDSKLSDDGDGLPAGVPDGDDDDAAFKDEEYSRLLEEKANEKK